MHSAIQNHKLPRLILLEYVSGFVFAIALCGWVQVDATLLEKSRGQVIAVLVFGAFSGLAKQLSRTLPVATHLKNAGSWGREVLPLASLSVRPFLIVCRWRNVLPSRLAGLAIGSALVLSILTYVGAVTPTLPRTLGEVYWSVLVFPFAGLLRTLVAPNELRLDTGTAEISFFCGTTIRLSTQEVRLLAEVPLFIPLELLLTNSRIAPLHGVKLRQFAQNETSR